VFAEIDGHSRFGQYRLITRKMGIVCDAGAFF